MKPFELNHGFNCFTRGSSKTITVTILYKHKLLRFQFVEGFWRQESGNYCCLKLTANMGVGKFSQELNSLELGGAKILGSWGLANCLVS